MRRRTLRKGCIFQKLLFCHRAVMNTTDLKDSLGHGAGFIKYHIFGLGKGFHVIGTFYQNALFAGTADTCKET